MGEGPPLIYMPPELPISHVALELRIPEAREWFEGLARRRTLVRYDNRGAGLSQREGVDFSPASMLRDLEAVRSQLGLSSFTLLVTRGCGPIALHYAAAHPERVSELILWGTYARSADYFRGATLEALATLMQGNWDVFVDRAILLLAGRSAAGISHNLAELIRAAVTQDAYRAAFVARMEYDASMVLSQIRSRTLVVHRTGDHAVNVDIARDLASRIPGASLALLEGDAGQPFIGDVHAALRCVDEFLDNRKVDNAYQIEEPRGGTAIILFADIVDSTALTERMGDAAFRAQARDLDDALRTIIGEAGGTAIEGKLLGDGVLAVFTSARQAIEAALACATAGDGGGLPLHLGLHAGDVIREEGNVYGGAVNIAARISGLSASGEVLVSETVRSLARTSAGVRFEDRGEQELKGVGEAVKVWAVVAQEQGTGSREQG
jgi:class 3 adenylate cyclase/pimeloyl-ACP methyl ester carboxylesterase